MDFEEGIDIQIKQESLEEITCDDNKGVMMDVYLSSKRPIKLENEVKKELNEEFANEIDENTKYLCEVCKTNFQNLSSLQDHMLNNDNCDEKNDVKRPNNSLNFVAMLNKDVKKASKEENYKVKPENEQEEKCNEKKTKRKRQLKEEKDNGIDLEKDERKKHHDGIFDTASFKILQKEETEGLNKNDYDELVNLVMKDHIILRTNNHGEKNKAIKTEASGETSRDSMCEKSNVHAEASNGNSKINNELCEKRHDTIMDVIGDAYYDDSYQKNASKCSNNAKRTKPPTCEELGTQKIPPESSLMLSKFDASNKLKTHVSNSRKKGASCEVCKKAFIFKSNIPRHMKQFHLKTNEKENTASPNQKHVCTICDKSYENREKLMSHINNSHKSPVFCNVCSKKFSRKANLKQHMKVFHLRIEETENLSSPNQKFVCNVCDRSYETSVRLQHHQIYHRSPKVCDICSKTFTSKYGLAEHIKRFHMGLKKVFECKFCEKKYFDKNGLNRHTRIYCTKKKRITCKLCTKKNFNQITLELHMADHPRFVCDYCDKIYYVRYHLQMHIEGKHMNLNVTKVCKICRKKYVSQKTLEMHMADHPRFICDYCDKVFYIKNSVLVHIKRSHLKVRRLCKKCGNKYDYLYLKQHMKRCKGNIEQYKI